MYETSCQSRFDARYWMLGAGALGQPRGMVWGGRREEVSGWGTHVYLWQIHFHILQNQYHIVKLNKIKFKKIKIQKKKHLNQYRSIFTYNFELNQQLLPLNEFGGIQQLGYSPTYLNSFVHCKHSSTNYLLDQLDIQYFLMIASIPRVDSVLGIII